MASLDHDDTIAHELVHRCLCRREGVEDPCDKDHDESDMWECVNRCRGVSTVRPVGPDGFADQP